MKIHWKRKKAIRHITNDLGNSSDSNESYKNNFSLIHAL